MCGNDPGYSIYHVVVYLIDSSLHSGTDLGLTSTIHPIYCRSRDPKGGLYFEWVVSSLDLKGTMHQMKARNCRIVNLNQSEKSLHCRPQSVQVSLVIF